MNMTVTILASRIDASVLAAIAPKAPKAKAKKPARGQRVEPGFADFGNDTYYDDAPPARSRGRAPKQKKPARGRRERKGFSVWGLFGKLIYWSITLFIIGGIAAGGIVYYYWMQMPSVTTWAVPERAPNPALARAFAAFLLSPDGRAILRAEGLDALDAPVARGERASWMPPE